MLPYSLSGSVPADNEGEGRVEVDCLAFTRSERADAASVRRAQQWSWHASLTQESACGRFWT